MTTTTRDAQALTYLAVRLREDTYGCGKWDQNGTYAVISELVGMNLAETIRRVVGHALDPEARTPGAIKRPFVPAKAEDPKAPRFPAKAGEDCRWHKGEHAHACRSCAADKLAGDQPTPRPTTPAEPTPAYLEARGRSVESEEA
jgi:hypothetical protein